MADSILIVGASGRAAAFSALRAGLTPLVIDLFADEDLRAVAEVRPIEGHDYPHRLPEIARELPPMPWMYTGGLENHPDIVAAIAAERELWGNGPDVLARVRDPFALAAEFERAGLPHPRVLPGNDRPVDGKWLLKPFRGSGGAGIRFAPLRTHGDRFYFQEFLDGESRSAIFRDGELLGVTRQLVGESWLHAPRFGYCGSVGPLVLSARELAAWRALGESLVRWCGVRGIFGIDAIMRGGVPWPVEVNPRYTAAVEVIELAGGRGFADPADSQSLIRRRNERPAKAIFYAPRTLVFPHNGPWHDCADIPGAGSMIRRGRPVLTIFGRDERELRERARMLDSLFAVEHDHASQ